MLFPCREGPGPARGARRLPHIAVPQSGGKTGRDGQAARPQLCEGTGVPTLPPRKWEVQPCVTSQDREAAPREGISSPLVSGGHRLVLARLRVLTGLCRRLAARGSQWFEFRAVPRGPHGPSQHWAQRPGTWRGRLPGAGRAALCSLPAGSWQVASGPTEPTVRLAVWGLA